MFGRDPDKNERNIEKHGISFEQAAGILLGPHIVAPTPRGGEERFAATGEHDGKYWTVVYTPRGNDVRIISARRARIDEQRAYRQLYP